MSEILILSIIKDFVTGRVGWYQSLESFRAWLPQYEVRILIIIVICILLVVLNSKWKKGPVSELEKILAERDTKNKNKEKNPLTHKWHFHQIKLLLNSIFLATLAVLLFMTFFIKPSVIITTPQIGEYMGSGEGPVEFIFDLPFDKGSIDFNVSPNVSGEWKVGRVSKFLPTRRKVTFYPDVSIYPEKEVVIYIVGIKSPLSPGKIHEQALEFKSPKIPLLTAIIPADQQKDVPVDQVLELEFDSPVGDFIRLDLNIEPDIEYATEIINENTIGVRFNEPLEQDQTYFIGVMQTPRSYDVDTGEDVEVGLSNLISSTTFSTVTTPLIENYSPRGDNVFIDEDIAVSFDQAMNKDSVEAHFSIEPTLNGQLEWVDDKTFTYSPESQMAKDTAYKLILSAGVKSGESGTINEDITLEFKTIGRVEVKDSKPIAGSYGLDPATTNIIVEFNQPVDKESAEENIEISPKVNGTYLWDGNKLIFQTAGRLSYSTKYDVKVKAGVKTVQGLDSIRDYSYSFVTKDNIFALSVPWYKQQEGFTCNVASTRMALAYRGVYVSEYEVKSGIGIGEDPNKNWVPGYGVHWGPVANYISQYRSVAVKSGWNIQELAQEVEKGNPVIVWWYNRYSQPQGAYTLSSGVTAYMGMHSEVVRGFVGSSSNPTGLMTNDPWRGQLTYSPTLFNSTWAYIGYKAVVVY